MLAETPLPHLYTCKLLFPGWMSAERSTSVLRHKGTKSLSKDSINSLFSKVAPCRNLRSETTSSFVPPFNKTGFADSNFVLLTLSLNILIAVCPSHSLLSFKKGLKSGTFFTHLIILDYIDVLGILFILNDFIRLS